jgi:hypothetical protein
MLLQPAVAGLTDDRLAVRHAALRELYDAGEVGIALLKREVRRGPDTSLASILDSLRSEGVNADDAILARIEHGMPPETLAVVLPYLGMPEGAVSDAHLTRLWDASPLGQPDATPQGPGLPLVAWLATYLRDHARLPSGSVDARFDADPYARVRAFAERAYTSDRDDVRLWASRHAATLGLRVPGFRAHYTAENPTFDLKRIDPAIDFAGASFPLPDGYADDPFRCQWTGVVHVEKPGRYRLRLSIDDQATLYLGGRAVVENVRVGTRETVVELEPGPSPIRVVFRQGGGGARAQLFWSGPGMTLQPLDAEWVSTTPWPLEEMTDE